MNRSKELPAAEPPEESSKKPAAEAVAELRIEEAVGLLKVLLDEDRLAILGLTAQRPYSVRELAAALPGRRTPHAKHVAEMVAVGLLAEVDNDQYALDVRQLQAWKRSYFARASQPVPESADEQVLATYVHDGKMIQYPAQPSKRLVVLRWLASRFEPNRLYPEREVNEMLAGHSEDHATLRRFLVDAALLARQDGVYRRVEEPAV